MVSLDQDLVSRAYACITDGQSSHRIRELIFAYRVAVDLHNHEEDSHVIYKQKYEFNLRDVVVEEERKRAERGEPMPRNRTD